MDILFELESPVSFCGGGGDGSDGGGGITLGQVCAVSVATANIGGAVAAKAPPRLFHI